MHDETETVGAWAEARHAELDMLEGEGVRNREMGE